MKKVSDIRSLGRICLAALTGLNLVASIGVSAVVGGQTGLIAVCAITLCLGALYTLRHVESATHRAIFAVLSQGQVAVFVAAFAGHAWQVDAHMHFFATMGILILLVDFRAIAAGAAAVAVHHLALNFMLPELVYPGGSDLGRTIMHAIILILATIALCFGSWALARVTEDAETLSIEREEMVNRLSSSIGAVVEQGVAGDFTHRIDDSFVDPRLQAIVEGTNKLMSSVNGSIDEVGTVMAKMATGDFTAKMDGEFTGAFAALQRQIDGTLARLNGVVKDIGVASDVISQEADKIATGSHGLSNQATQQAASIEETSASIQTLSETVKTYDGSVQRMSERAAQSLRQGQVGRETVDKATSAMAEMSSSAERINEVVTMMSEISFQTNLLALNASVEAARAGSAGKGFAVVAQEVRALAQRSAASEDEIRQLISASSTSVSTGVRFVDELGVTLGEILTLVEEVAQMASDMSDNTKEQATYMHEISCNVAGIDQTTQNTALSAEAYLEQSNLLKTHSDHLNGLMQLFVVGDASTREPVRDDKEAA